MAWIVSRKPENWKFQMVYKWLDSRLQRTDQKSDIQPRAQPMVAKIFAKAIWGEIAFE